MIMIKMKQVVVIKKTIKTSSYNSDKEKYKIKDKIKGKSKR
jgi:hypothetical protein|nr:MAG TPA: hypothetical protein [Crassvirales sp.]